jgi:hypothetical protein
MLNQLVATHGLFFCCADYVEAMDGIISCEQHEMKTFLTNHIPELERRA